MAITEPLKHPAVDTAMASQPSPSAPRFGLWPIGRFVLFAVAAGLPVLSISAHVFGVVPIHRAASYTVLPMQLVALVLVLARAPEATVVKHGAVAGLIAVAAYDGTRLPFVLLGLWADFIPRVGGWVVVNEGFPALHATLGYTWRYLGNGLGIGVFFFLVCSVLRVRQHFVALAVAYGVFVWSGLMATVVLAPHGQELLFALTPLSVSVSLAGHLVYGLVLGLVKARFTRRNAVAVDGSRSVHWGGRHRRPSSTSRAWPRRHAPTLSPRARQGSRHSPPRNPTAAADLRAHPPSSKPSKTT